MRFKAWSSTILLGVLCACGTSEAPRGAKADASLDAVTSVDAGDPDATMTPAATLPIEVIGVCTNTPCASRHVVIDGRPARAGERTWLELVIHNLVRPSSASVDFNGRSTVLSRSEWVRVQGGVQRIELEVDSESVLARNSLRFDYLTQVPDVSGFRVLEVALHVGDDLYQPPLEWDEPQTWQTVSDAPGAVEQGRKYFQDEARDGGPPCARCHVTAGDDLQYFAFSNHAIIERAALHEFDAQDGALIASYIRSLPVSLLGRTFQPPFQPGEGNQGGAGAGYDTVVDDERFGQLAFADGLPDEIPWDIVAEVDLYSIAAPVQLPSWFQWLPRDFDDAWLGLRASDDGPTLGELAATYDSEPTIENGAALMSAAESLGRAFYEQGDPLARLDLVKFASVKLWGGSLQLGFDRPDHGFASGMPAYPYEIGFVIFEAPEAFDRPYTQVMEWWWGQLAVNAGRGESDGKRPLNYRDVLIAAEGAALGPNAILFLHLYGSWEESRGAMADRVGSEAGPVRLLEVPSRVLPPVQLSRVWKRYLSKEQEWLEQGIAFSITNRQLLQKAWAEACPRLDLDQQAQVRASAAASSLAQLSECTR